MNPVKQSLETWCDSSRRESGLHTAMELYHAGFRTHTKAVDIQASVDVDAKSDREMVDFLQQLC